jgi:lysophospholipase L1-like esterase
MARSNFRFRLAVTVATLAVFPLLEIGLRLSGFLYVPADEPLSIWNPSEDRAMRFGSGMFTAAPRQLWAPRPGAKVVWGDGERINEGGYRGPLRPAGDHPGVVRVLVLGESCAFGYGVPYADTFSSRLEEILRASGRDVEVVNGGVIGYTVRQGLERYRAMGRPYRPDFVVAAFGEVNEHFPAGGPSDVEKIEMPLDERDAWSEVVWLFRREVRVAHLFASLVDGMNAQASLERSLKFKERHYEHSLREHMGDIDWKGRRRVSIEDFVAANVALAKEVRADGGRLVLLSSPRRKAAEDSAPVLPLYTRAVEELARRGGLLVANAHRAFAEAQARGVQESDLFRDPWHLSADGHREVARTLAATIEPLLDPR